MARARSAATTRSGPPLQWPLVGRHEELELFSDTLTDPRAHGFVIHGPPGVGKTRLADQCLALADQAGRNVARATATEGSCEVPLGAVAHLLPAGLGDERCDLVAVVSQIRSVLQDQSGTGPLVLFVDDLHLLDSTSATLVGQLVDADLLFLVATVRSTESVPRGLESLWHRARVRRIDLDDLDRAAVDTLVHLILRGPVEASTVTELWTASQGNVLFVRELVLAGLDGGQLVEQRGVWRLVGPLVATPRLHELLAARLGCLPPAVSEALDVLAVWEPTGLSTLEETVGREPLEHLDRAGLIAVRAEGRRQQVTLAHPLYGEILRGRMPALTRRRLLLALADRIDAYGARRREDAVRLATARLEATGWADPALLVKAARLARYGQDFSQVERLGQAALLGGTTPEAGLLVGEALHELGRFGEAEQVLSAASAEDIPDGALRVQLTEIRSRNLMWGLLRFDDALAVNDAGRTPLEDPADVEELDLNEALLLAYSGRPLDALDVLAPIADPTRPRARALKALAEVPSLVATGRCERATDAAGRAFAEHSVLPEQIAIPGPGVHLVTQVYALAECGRLAEASALAMAAYEGTPANAPPDALIWFAHQLGRCALLAGHPATARRWLAEALARCEAYELVSAHRLVLSALATAHAWLGDGEAAAAAVRELDRCPPHPFVASEHEMGRAWAVAAAGDLPGARQILRAAAERAASGGYWMSEAWLLHDVARLGDPSAVAGRLAELAGACEGGLVSAYAEHTAARTAAALVDVTDHFEAMGAVLLAAEVATEASQVYQRDGDRRASAALGVRASTLARQCEGARTPGLIVPVVVVPLTARERDIAVLAAQGDSSKEIAERLFLSVRTVDNHLQNVYSKLGVSGRRQLSAALADLDVSTSAGGPWPPTASSRR